MAEAFALFSVKGGIIVIGFLSNALSKNRFSRQIVSDIDEYHGVLRIAGKYS
jgi:hypothetical protein